MQEVSPARIVELENTIRRLRSHVFSTDETYGDRCTALVVKIKARCMPVWKAKVRARRYGDYHWMYAAE